MKRSRVALALLVLIGLLATPAAAQANAATDTSSWCARQFERTVHQRDAAFDARDLPRLMTFYRDDAVEVDPTGAAHLDKKAISEQIGFLFSLDFTPTFRTLKTDVNGCGTALLVLDSTFYLAGPDITQHFITAQTFTFTHGRWKILLAANTLLSQ